MSKEIDDARINLLMGLFYNIDTFFNKSIDTLSILKINEYKESLMIGYNENLYEVIRFKFPKIDFY